ncbi:hypothetical protein M8J71_23060 [Pseudarthrobacter sp. R1]|uniref:hypothetical protein n=1 Tax=Pseudarthrobacter sp. R1 TaxID=2944934 RepID=UPI00210AB5E7|nr:hypothetical protein [Pseudarthrobacter sp. R1]MCQ6273326.1 hypothetical protein [Pseudarthrobacter sp. R1]
MTCYVDVPAHRDLASFDKDWKQLIGTRAEVHHGGKLIRAGIIDDIMTDSGIVWLASNGVERRVLYDINSGYQIRLLPGGP